MFSLVIGGAASGKSEYGEKLITYSESVPGIYIATMKPYDDECLARIEKHRKMRERKSFETVECYTGLKELKLPCRCAALLECMGNLTANELFDPEGAGDDSFREICSGIDNLLSQCKDLVVVSNDVFSGGCDYDDGTIRYLKVLADINRYMACIADNVYEIVCGQAICHKGEVFPN